MRLLNVHTLEFHVFYSDKVPQYVIASHRWVGGAEAEATFIDIQEKRNTGKTGYQKVEAFADYVRKHIPSVEWLWIDTCCINKQDSAELSEAINSMFRWYSDATVCLAYLTDVRASGDIDGFAKSEWFRRGWTLQELLAPEAVVFLTQDWQVIGQKAGNAERRSTLTLPTGPTLNMTIAGLTGIPETVLSDFQRCTSLPVRERLGWMENRETTRQEDMSYCLLGIFDISMPAIYGEGEDRARRRLLAEISKDNAVLDKLPVALGAAFDDRENEHVSECLPATRVDLLREIDEWASSENGACIFWLGGMAGTGKSTIFKSIAQKFSDQNRLAATFCFKRGEADRGHASRLITTISAQLAKRLPNVRKEVISALEKDADVVRKTLKEQFQTLMLQPLQCSASPPVHGPAWIIGIDALDECDEESDIHIVIDLLSKLKGLQSANFRLLVTSRPDLPIQLGFSGIPNDTHHDIRLEEISKDSIAQDIAVYLRHNLAGIQSNYAKLSGINALRQDWPGEDAVQALVQMAQPLFIFAATVCRLLAEPDEDPEESLGIILAHRIEATQLDRTYKPVLDRLLFNQTRRQQERRIEEFKAVVGSIVILAEPLSIPALSKLLDVSEMKVNARLRRLHSVLYVPVESNRSSAVRPLHLSFRDYLTDPDTREKTPFWIDESQQHRLLAYKCLECLSQGEILKQDLCGVEIPGTRRMEIDKHRIESSINPEVAYACSYWVWHLVKGGEQLHDNCQAHQFLQLHFLHWLEALSWLGRLSGLITSISDLQAIVSVEHGVTLLAFLGDASRFVLRNRYTIDLAPLQTYSSALLFTPTRSIVRAHFEGEIPKWILSRPQVPTKWSAELLKLEGHSQKVTEVAFSPDGKVVASASNDGTVRLWSTTTGEQIHVLEDYYSTLAFSSNKEVIYSCSSTDLVLRDTRTGHQTRRLKFGKDEKISRPLAISSDGQLAASMVIPGQEVTLRDTKTGQETQRLAGFNGSVQMVISIDGQVVASEIRSVRIWDIRTGKLVQTLETKVTTTAMAFSPGEKVMALASFDGTVWLWHLDTGELMQNLAGLGRDFVKSLAFSPDGQVIVSGHTYGTIQLWDPMRQDQLQRLGSHESSVSAIAYSPVGHMLASGSSDKTVRLWDVSAGKQEQQEEGGIDKKVLTIALSTDKSVVVSASSDFTVRFWDVKTGQQTQKNELPHFGDTIVDISPDGQMIATIELSNVGAQYRMRLRDGKTGEWMHIFEVQEEPIDAIAFSPDGQIVALASCDNLRLRDAKTGEVIHRINNVRVSQVVFSDYKTLSTDVGDFDIETYVRASPISDSTELVRSGPWVRYRDKDILWLPHEYRQGYEGACPSVAYGDFMAFGHKSGQVSILRFDVHSLAASLSPQQGPKQAPQ